MHSALARSRLVWLLQASLVALEAGVVSHPGRVTRVSACSDHHQLMHLQVDRRLMRKFRSYRTLALVLVAASSCCFYIFAPRLQAKRYVGEETTGSVLPPGKGEADHLGRAQTLNGLFHHPTTDPGTKPVANHATNPGPNPGTNPTANPGMNPAAPPAARLTAPPTALLPLAPPISAQVISLHQLQDPRFVTTLRSRAVRARMTGAADSSTGEALLGGHMDQTSWQSILFDAKLSPDTDVVASEDPRSLCVEVRAEQGTSSTESIDVLDAFLTRNSIFEPVGEFCDHGRPRKTASGNDWRLCTVNSTVEFAVRLELDRVQHPPADYRSTRMPAPVNITLDLKKGVVESTMEADAALPSACDLSGSTTVTWDIGWGDQWYDFTTKLVQSVFVFKQPTVIEGMAGHEYMYGSGKVHRSERPTDSESSLQVAKAEVLLALSPTGSLRALLTSAAQVDTRAVNQMFELGAAGPDTMKWLKDLLTHGIAFASLQELGKSLRKHKTEASFVVKPAACEADDWTCYVYSLTSCKRGSGDRWRPPWIYFWRAKYLREYFTAKAMEEVQRVRVRLSQLAFPDAEAHEAHGTGILLWIVRHWATRSRYDMRRTVARKVALSRVALPCYAIHSRESDTQSHARQTWPISAYVLATGGQVDSVVDRSESELEAAAESVASNYSSVVLLTDTGNSVIEAVRQFPLINWRYLPRDRHTDKAAIREQNPHVPSGNPRLEVEGILSAFELASGCEGLSNKKSAFANMIMEYQCAAHGWISCWSRLRWRPVCDGTCCKEKKLDFSIARHSCNKRRRYLPCFSTHSTECFA
jgi:hypothetical protein